jgi:hypothetical protein
LGYLLYSQLENLLVC